MKILWLLIAALLAACSTVPRQTARLVADSATEPEQSWQNWQLHARISVRTESDGWFAAMDWRQDGDTYRLHISGPFGQGAAQVTGNGSMVRLHTHDGQVFVDENPDTLIRRVLGVEVPVRGLRYWVRGLRDPSQPSRSRWQPNGLRAELHQSGWIIHYDAYVSEAGQLLPSRIKMENQGLKLRLLIDSWEKIHATQSRFPPRPPGSTAFAGL